jgi:hypothetical protein
MSKSCHRSLEIVTPRKSDYDYLERAVRFFRTMFRPRLKTDEENQVRGTKTFRLGKTNTRETTVEG